MKTTVYQSNISTFRKSMVLLISSVLNSNNDNDNNNDDNNDDNDDNNDDNDDNDDNNDNNDDNHIKFSLTNILTLYNFDIFKYCGMCFEQLI